MTNLVVWRVVTANVARLTSRFAPALAERSGRSAWPEEGPGGQDADGTTLVDDGLTSRRRQVRHSGWATRSRVRISVYASSSGLAMLRTQEFQGVR